MQRIEEDFVSSKFIKAESVGADLEGDHQDVATGLTLESKLILLDKSTMEVTGDPRF